MPEHSTEAKVGTLDPFSQQNLQPSHEFVVAILEKHLFCAQHYAQMIEQKVK
jgi:hypothetical protein